MATREATTAQEVQETDDIQENGDGKRERSKIEFPYLDLDVAVGIAKGVHEVNGTSCQWEQLAAHLHQEANGSGFRLRVMTAKTFGLVTYGQGTVTLTKLGTQVADPQQEAAAKAEAFLSVELYSAIYEKFKSGTLPPADGLENAMASLGVASKQKGKARQAFQRSAKEAGFFWSGPNRLVRPAIKGSAGTSSAAEHIQEKPDDEKKKKKEESEDDGKHPLIEGLIKALPSGGEDWPLESRKKWLQAAAMNFAFVYTDSKRDSTEDQESLKVSIERESSAK